MTGVLTIRLDGTTEDLMIPPDTLVASSALTVGRRVWVQQWGSKVIILGVANGP